MQSQQAVFPELAEDLALERERRMARVSAGPKHGFDPQAFASAGIFGVDFGAGKAFVYSLLDASGFEVRREAIADTLLRLPPGSLVVAEHAHLGVPRLEASRAQVLPQDELARLYELLRSREITLRLFPQNCTRKARGWASFRSGQFPDHEPVETDKGGDMNDAKALAIYVAHSNRVSLAKPPKSFGRRPQRDYGWAVVQECNKVLNAWKQSQYDQRCFPVLRDLSNAITRYCEDNHHESVNATLARVVAATVASHDGRRFTYKGNTPGYRLWKENVAGMSAFKGAGGVPRCTIQFFTFRSRLNRVAGDFGAETESNFGEMSDLAIDCHGASWREIRDDLRAAYRFAIEFIVGWEGFEILKQHKQGEASCQAVR